MHSLCCPPQCFAPRSCTPPGYAILVARHVDLSELLLTELLREEQGTNNSVVLSASSEVQSWQKGLQQEGIPDAKTSGQSGFGLTHFTEP